MRSLLSALFRRSHRDLDMDEELRAHIEHRADDLERSGFSRSEAHRQASIEFGGYERYKEECREASGAHFFETLFQDVRFGLRTLRKSPGFAAIAVLTLALGIGATTAMFSVVQGVMLAPLPYPHPDRLVLIWQSNPHAPHVSLSLPDFRDWQRDARSFEALSGLRWYEFNLNSPGNPEHVDGYEIPSGFFKMLGVRPAMGREFSPQEDQPGGTPVALISAREWDTRYGSSPDILGKSITLSGVTYTIIGVLPSKFRLASPVDVYIPLAQGDPAYNDRRFPGVLGIGRLKSGVSIAQAQAEMTAVQQNLDRLYPETDQGLGVDVLPLKSAIVGDISATLFLMLGAVAAVLLIACANVANLLLARSATRVREFTIRSALGAARSRIVRQLLTESILLSVAGGVVGLVFAKLGIKAVLTMLAGNLARTENVRLNSTVLLFALGISVAVGILFGLAPAFKTMSSDLNSTLKQAGRGTTGGHHRMQNVLVVGQMALSLVLLAGATLLFRSIRDMWKTDPGFTPQNVLTFRIGSAPSATDSNAQIRGAYQNLIQRIRAIPGVEMADATDLIPLNQANNFAPFWVGTQETTPVAEAPRLLLYWTGPDYLATMKIPVLQGRYFSEQDGTNSEHVVVVDSVLAEKYFHGKNPIGESININLCGPMRIIGVVGHIRHSGLGDPAALAQVQAYAPLAQVPEKGVRSFYSGLAFIVRTPLDEASILPQIEAAVSGRNGGQPIYEVHTMQDIIADSMTSQRFPMVLLGIFAGFALLLASLGTYSVISYSTVQRTPEIGIRMALGAERSNVFQLVLRQGIRLASIGVLIGGLAALVLARLLSSFSHLLYGVRAWDPVTLGGVSLLLVCACLLACYIPARRATRTDPMIALRHE
ncbi:MAG TPA: ABC transporter permease [Candidatus Angelobacter sp.]|nr:ABC transporter permease [Candidatus Angelobacter sp.]